MSNYIKDGKPDNLTVPPNFMPATGQTRRVVCLDWVAYNSCTFVCPHCHPKDGLSRRAKMFKTYYVLGGETAQTAGVYLMNEKQASLFAKMIMQERIKPGYSVIRSADNLEVATTIEDWSFGQGVDASAVRGYFYDNRLSPIPENTPIRLWWGMRFSGMGCIQFHEDVVLTQRDLEARNSQYSREIIRKFVDEDLQRASVSV